MFKIFIFVFIFFYFVTCSYGADFCAYEGKVEIVCNIVELSSIDDYDVKISYIKDSNVETIVVENSNELKITNGEVDVKNINGKFYYSIHDENYWKVMPN